MFCLRAYCRNILTITTCDLKGNKGQWYILQFQANWISRIFSPHVPLLHQVSWNLAWYFLHNLAEKKTYAWLCQDNASFSNFSSKNFTATWGMIHFRVPRVVFVMFLLPFLWFFLFCSFFKKQIFSPALKSHHEHNKPLCCSVWNRSMCVYAFEVFESVMSVCIYVFVSSIISNVIYFLWCQCLAETACSHLQ